MRLAFTAYGLPVTQGSMRGTLHKTTGRVVVIQDHSKALREWRRTIAWEAAKSMNGSEPFDRACVLRVRFVLPRPKSAPKSRAHPDRKPDVSKLARALEDALTNVIYVDDARIVELNVSKTYGEPARAEVEVYVL